MLHHSSNRHDNHKKYKKILENDIFFIVFFAKCSFFCNFVPKFKYQHYYYPHNFKLTGMSNGI